MMRFWRVLKALTIHPMRCRSDEDMAEILSERPATKQLPSRSIYECTTF